MMRMKESSKIVQIWHLPVEGVAVDGNGTAVDVKEGRLCAGHRRKTRSDTVSADHHGHDPACTIKIEVLRLQAESYNVLQSLYHVEETDQSART